MHTLQINVNGSNTIDIAAGSSYAIEKFIPRHPNQDSLGVYDLVTPIEDVIDIVVIGSSADDLAEKISAIDRVLHNATRYSADKTTGYLTEMVWKPQGATNSATTEVLGGWVDYPDEFMGAQLLSRVIENVKLHVVHRPVWEGSTLSSGTDFSFTTSVSNNGASNYFQLPSLKGDLDALVKIRYAGASGNIANCNKIICGVRANQTPANFIHMLKVANVSGYTVTVDPDSTGHVSNSVQTEFVSGYKMRYNPTSGEVDTEIKLARWVISSNVADQYGNFWVVVRYRDTSSSPNFSLRFRGGLSDGTNIDYGNYTTDFKIKTRYNTSDNSEIALLDLGAVAVPAVGNFIQTNKYLVYELLATPHSASGNLDIDYVALFPLGEMDNHGGLQVSDFTYSFSSKYVYVDSRLRQEKSYITNTSDEKLYSPKSLYTGGDIRLRPQKSGQRVYFNICSSDGYSKHNAANTATVTLSYVPQYIRIRGTT